MLLLLSYGFKGFKYCAIFILLFWKCTNKPVLSVIDREDAIQIHMASTSTLEVEIFVLFLGYCHSWELATVVSLFPRRTALAMKPAVLCMLNTCCLPLKGCNVAGKLLTIWRERCITLTCCQSLN